MTTVKFHKKLLFENDLPSAAIEDRITGLSRWNSKHEIVFELDGKHYQTTYERGATEMSEERPWEYEDEVECTEVHRVEVTCQVWRPVDA